MTLLEIRQKFAELSGRYDLVDTESESWADAGADFFIQAGQRMLDRWGDFDTGNSGILTLSVGQSPVSLERCWRVNSVSLQLAPDKWELLQSVTSQKAFSNCHCDAGIKGYFLERVFQLPRFGPKSKADKYSQQRAINFALKADDHSYSELKLSLVPKPREARTVRIHGLFAEPPLVEDQDENMWSVQHPMLLLKAALYQLEVCYRNTEGANDWLSAIVAERKEMEDQQLFGALSPSAEMGADL